MPGAVQGADDIATMGQDGVKQMEIMHKVTGE